MLFTRLSFGSRYARDFAAILAIRLWENVAWCRRGWPRSAHRFWFARQTRRPPVSLDAVYLFEFPSDAAHVYDEAILCQEPLCFSISGYQSRSRNLTTRLSEELDLLLVLDIVNHGAGVLHGRQDDMKLRRRT